ncbi:ADP-ribosylglycohydrolase [Duganella caerulea]|uniref:ADP-ribosylglycohydrolase family protein n=1 Tax=Duganella caerulea TaxID=2885762 RepID=UPI0030E87FF6
MPQDRWERIRGGLYGLLIGDALGVPYEFSSPEDIPERHLIEMSPPSGFARAHRAVPVGTWSDDGAQALVLLESLVACSSLDLKQFSDGLLAWYRTGFMTPDGHVFDIGIQTMQALGNYARSGDPLTCSPSDERNNGNGSLMRALPCAFFLTPTSTDIIARARKQSMPTHAHLRSQLACALYALMAWQMVEGRTPIEALDYAQGTLEEAVHPTERLELGIVLDGRLEPSKGSGYVVDSLWSAIRCVLATSDYEACLRNAIALGNDTDTTACIAGGLAGILYGERGIPVRWTEALNGRAIVENVLSRLAITQAAVA